MKFLAIAAQGFLGLAFVGWVAWVVARFTGPIMRVSHDGFRLLVVLCLLFAVAIGVVKLAFFPKAGS